MSSAATWRLSLNNAILCIKSNIFSQNWENKQSSPLCAEGEGRAGPAMRGSPGKIFTLRWKLHIRCIIQGVATSGHIHCPGPLSAVVRPCPDGHPLMLLFSVNCSIHNKAESPSRGWAALSPSHSHTAVTINCYTEFTEEKNTWIKLFYVTFCSEMAWQTN